VEDSPCRVSADGGVAVEVKEATANARATENDERLNRWIKFEGTIWNTME
jgi:hypothetical protein